MDSLTRLAVETRRLYHFEDIALPVLSPHTTARAPMKQLRRLAFLVWQEHGRKGERCPEVMAGEGLRYGGRALSYCAGRTLIVLAPGQRTVSVLLHELTHALGHGTHGKGFTRRFLELMEQYGRADIGLLELGAGLYGVKLRAPRSRRVWRKSSRLKAKIFKA